MYILGKKMFENMFSRFKTNNLSPNNKNICVWKICSKAFKKAKIHARKHIIQIMLQKTIDHGDHCIIKHD